MKKLFFAALAVILMSWCCPVKLLAQCQSFYDVDPSTADKKAEDQASAQQLKKDGNDLSDQASKASPADATKLYAEASVKYEAAAKLAPVPEVSAMYYWKAAAAAVGHLNKDRDWAINEVLSKGQKERGLSLLASAEKLLADPSPYCHKGVNVDVLKDLIEKVRACINGQCK